MAPRTTYATLADGLQPFSLWDQSLADMGLLGTIPCSATGTNTIALTPLTAAFAPNITAYTNYLEFSFVAPNTTTNTTTINVAGVGAKNAYLTDGTTQVGSGTLTAGAYYVASYSSALNSGVGGFFVSNLVSSASIPNGSITYAKLASAAQGLTNVRSAKTTTYAAVNADKGNTLALGGSAFYTLSFGAASGYDANFMVLVVNEDTGRGKTIACNGISSFILWPGQSVLVYNQNNVWKIFGRTRWKLTAGVTLFVDPAGSNNNDGLSTGASGALQTLNFAVNLVAGNQFDLFANAAPQLTIQLADGTHTGGLHYPGVMVGGAGNATVVVQGNSGTPSNVIITSGVALFDGAVIELKNLKIEDAATGFGLSMDSGSICRLQTGVVFGTVSAGGSQIFLGNGAKLTADAGITVSAGPQTGSGYFINASGPGTNVVFQGQSVTYTADAAYTTILLAGTGALINVGGTTFSNGGHTITGTAYSYDKGSLITTFGAGTGGLLGSGGSCTVFSGDVVQTFDGALSISTNAVTNAQAAQMTTNTIKGNNTGGTANASDLTVSQVRSLLGIGSIEFAISSVNFNSANTDNAIAITLPTGATRYRVNQVYISGASGTLTTSTVGVFTSTGGGGAAVIAGGTAVTVSTASDATANNAQVLAGGVITYTASTLYFRIGTPQGSAATANVAVIIIPQV